MYTTLEFLKENDACKDGYGEMLSFFGVSPKMKKVKIPLSVCAIALSKDHFNWLIENAVIVDPQEYAAFRKRWVLPLLHATMWGNTPKKTEKRYKTYIEFASVKTSEEAEALLEEDRFKMRNEVTITQHDYWWHAGAFVGKVVDQWSTTVNYRHRDFRDETRLEVREKLAPVPSRYYFELPERHVAYLFSHDPYKDTAEFMMKHGEYMPHKTLNIMPADGDQPIKATLSISGTRDVVQMAKFLADQRANKSDAPARLVLERDNEDENDENDESEED